MFQTPAHSPWKAAQFLAIRQQLVAPRATPMAAACMLRPVLCSLCQAVPQFQATKLTRAQAYISAAKTLVVRSLSPCPAAQLATTRPHTAAACMSAAVLSSLWKAAQSLEIRPKTEAAYILQAVVASSPCPAAQFLAMRPQPMVAACMLQAVARSQWKAAQSLPTQPQPMAAVCM